jgi:hypothetical protein
MTVGCFFCFFCRLALVSLENCCVLFFQMMVDKVDGGWIKRVCVYVDRAFDEEMLF